MRLLLVLCLGLGGCQFLLEPTPEPRYRWVSYAHGGGHWEQHPSGQYVWSGNEYHNIVTTEEAVTAYSKRWRDQ